MNFEVARKAIDFFLEHSIETSDVVIGFMEGAPCLNSNLSEDAWNMPMKDVRGNGFNTISQQNATLLR